MNHLILWLSVCHITHITGERLCKHERLKHFNISTELQSDVLLPCNFDPTLLGSNKSADIKVLWSQINTTEHYLVEISLQGDMSSWDSKGGRIKYFSKPFESGNFSILIQKVQLYDLSLYHCVLLNGTGCIVAYQEIQLGKWTGVNVLVENWPFIAGGGAGALAVLVVLTCFIKCACCNASNQHIYANSRFEKRNDRKCGEKNQSSDQHAMAKNKVHANTPRNHSNIYANGCAEPEEIYANQPH
ncbi:uncharacterized protein LOC128512627 isoform X2 [Clarias gariepinus]|uniref:uncharacterized protein LOC128512627 isoform X2 n=1 Tax=Clarias gariepinus TaxID=13013 RepID=UPI00234C4C2D|nr:uncharacterized protein LOC128512627 isoform X2 [Clarias gariepinus]